MCCPCVTGTGSEVSFLLLEANILQREQYIKNQLTQNSANVADAAVELWQQMATQIIYLLGEDGFELLYTRSVFLTQRSYPWIAHEIAHGVTHGTHPLQTKHGFEELKASLQDKSPEQAIAASSLLLITLTDILAVLIGEELTTHILRKAWSCDTLQPPRKSHE